jgi:raffinose/stachyose/melibiose transport system permease protein
MFPLYTLLRKIGLLNTLPGFILAKVGMQLGYCVIITTGFVKNIPRELEAAAYIDGCGASATFFRVIFPLLQPIMLTSTIINVLSFWNDFSTAFVILSTPKKYIVSLLQFSFMGTNSNEMQLAFAMFIMTMIPVLGIYFIFQKYIISGITAGSVKG